MNTVKELLTAEELADRLRVRPGTIRLWGREGRIPRIEVSTKTIRFDLSEVIAALRGQSATAHGGLESMP